jgi:hypothetical protein
MPVAPVSGTTYLAVDARRRILTELIKFQSPSFVRSRAQALSTFMLHALWKRIDASGADTRCVCRIHRGSLVIPDPIPTRNRPLAVK